MSIFYEIQQNNIILTGATYQIKDKIRTNGGKWNIYSKVWYFSFNNENLQIIQNMGFIEKQISANLIKTEQIEKVSEKILNSNKTENINEILTVGMFLNLLKNKIKKILEDSFQYEVWISGEISGIKISKGHTYFDLVDEHDNNKSLTLLRSSYISCALWEGKKRELQNKFTQLNLEDGLKVKLLLQIDFRTDGSKFIATIIDIDTEYTLGNLLLQRENIIKELKKRGLYDRNKSFKISNFPLNIALITAKDSRAHTDFIDELKISTYSFNIIIFDTHMQGENASLDIVNAVQIISTNYDNYFDCIIISRGGGSKLDLRWFDDLEICKSIAYANIPVITAIGHFDDHSIADEVAWLSEKTPTGAARYLVNKILNSLNEINTKFIFITTRIRKRLQIEKEILIKKEISIINLVKRKIDTENNKINLLYQTLKVLKNTNEKSLSRGYALIRDNNKKILCAKDFLTNNVLQNIEINLYDALTKTDCFINCKVENIKIVKDENKCQ